MQVTYVDGTTRNLGTIFCMARTYGAHAKELGNPLPKSPVVFCKPETAFTQGDTLLLPDFTKEVHYETELVVQLGKGGRYIPEEKALDFICGVALGLDLTARDVQEDLKNKGHPWELAKGFDGAAALSDFVFCDGVDLERLSFSMHLNGVLRQSGKAQEMIFSVAQQIAFLSRYFSLRAGDLLFTGTPEGVGALHKGDVVEVFSSDLNLSKKWSVL